MLADDEISAQRLKLVYPDVRVRWLRLVQDFYNLHGLQLRIAQGLRTYPDQEKIYELGRSMVNGQWEITDPHKVVTYAQPGDSWHHYSAIDSCFMGADPWLEHNADGEKMWAEYARLGEAHGFEAGYRWEGKKQDRPHLQIRYGGMDLKAVKKIYEQGKLRKVWSTFDTIRKVVPGSEWSGQDVLDALTKLGVLD